MARLLVVVALGAVPITACANAADDRSADVSTSSATPALDQLPPECTPQANASASGEDTSWPLAFIAAQPVRPADGTGVVVAIIDSGLSPGIVPADRVLSQSRSFIDGEPLDADDGHGTHMAQLVHTVAPGAGILAFKALTDRGTGSASTVADAVRAATAQRADVISLSFESAGLDPDLRSALEDAAAAGTILVIAAGNEQLDLDRFPRYPASLELPHALVVAAMDSSGRLAASTNWGRTTVDVAAPGEQIPVTRPDRSPTIVSGSSPATALVAGAAAVLLQHATAANASIALEHAVIRRASLHDTVSSRGSVDIESALACAAALG